MLLYVRTGACVSLFLHKKSIENWLRDEPENQKRSGYILLPWFVPRLSKNLFGIGLQQLLHINRSSFFSHPFFYNLPAYKQPDITGRTLPQRFCSWRLICVISYLRRIVVVQQIVFDKIIPYRSFVTITTLQLRRCITRF